MKNCKTKVEKDFYKLLNNSNFGNDCRNNIDQCKLELIYDGLDEISYLKRFTNIMQDHRYREFFSLDLMRQQVNREYQEKKEKLDNDDPFYLALLDSLNQKKEEDLEAIELFANKKKENLS